MAAMPADVLHLHGHGYHLLAPVAMRLPVEILHQIYTLLDPYDFNSSRHTCRAWFWAGMNRSVLVDMLKRGGWWSSVENILKMEQHLVPPKQNLDQTTIMSKWIARECTLGPRPGGLDPPFVEIGRTQFDGLGVSYSTSGTRKDTAIFTTSICGRCLIVSYGGIIYVYELNHNCRITGSHSSSASPWNQDQRHQKGLLRPVAAILCPHRVISCALDTSWGRYAIAAVLDGRNGFVCDITGLRTSFELSKGPSTQFVNNVGKFGVGAAMGNPHQPCVCQQPPASLPPALETGPRAIYRNLCRADDPPRSVAICPQRKCVAFGCSSAVELHWVDGLTDQDLVRRFPLSTPSDFLYFLPPRPSFDSEKKLRLISSVSSVDTTSRSAWNILGALNSAFGGYPQEVPAVISRLETSASGPESAISSIYAITEQQHPVSSDQPSTRRAT